MPVELQDLDADPIRQFERWHADAGTEAMTLVTASADGEPAGRMVLLKGLDHRGFVFHTNYESAKAAALATNPRAALVFFWPPDRQVRVTGGVERISREDSEAYWRTRPRASQLGAWASPQSQVIAGWEVLEQRVADLDRQFADGEVPLPPFWGGYRVRPDAIEFWHHQEDRLHDRFRYRRAGGDWIVERLAP